MKNDVFRIKGCLKDDDYKNACPFYNYGEYEFCSHPDCIEKFNCSFNKILCPPPEWCPLREVPKFIIILDKENDKDKLNSKT